MNTEEDVKNLGLQFKSDESIANELKTMQVMLDRVRSITTKSTAQDLASSSRFLVEGQASKQVR